MKKRISDLRSTESYEVDLYPILFDFQFLLEGFYCFGNLSDALEWKKNQKICTIFNGSEYSSMKFFDMADGKIGLTNFRSNHEESITVTGSYSLVAFLLDQSPEDNIPPKKYAFLLRGITATLNGIHTKSIQALLKSLRFTLTELETRHSLFEIIRMAWLFVEIFANGNAGKYFFVSCRELAKFIKCSHEEANQILNLLCILGYLEKQTKTGGINKADRFKMINRTESYRNNWILMRPLTTLKSINRYNLSRLGIEKDFLNNIFQ